MKLLAIETSGKICGVCIAENNRILDKIEVNNGLTHSETLMPLIKKILKNNNLNIQDINSFVCDIGPGSFTGIRIGVATLKAFIDSLPHCKYTGINSLEVLAYNAQEDGFICSIIDCKNNNCYFSLYNLKNYNYIEVIPPTSASTLELFNTLKQYNSTPITFVGDGVITYKDDIIANLSNAVFLDEDYNQINTSNLALAGFKNISNNNITELSPLYLKKPQAQRQLEEKLKKNC